MASSNHKRRRPRRAVSRKRVLEVEGPRIKKARGSWVPLRRYKNSNSAHVAKTRVLRQVRSFRPRVEVKLDGTTLYGRLRRA